MPRENKRPSRPSTTPTSIWARFRFEACTRARGQSGPVGGRGWEGWDVFWHLAAGSQREAEVHGAAERAPEARAASRHGSGLRAQNVVGAVRHASRHELLRVACRSEPPPRVDLRQGATPERERRRADRPPRLPQPSARPCERRSSAQPTTAAPIRRPPQARALPFQRGERGMYTADTAELQPTGPAPSMPRQCCAHFLQPPSPSRAQGLTRGLPVLAPCEWGSAHRW